MDIKDLIGFGVTFAGMAFGFGRQSSEIKTLRRDVDAIGKSHRDIMLECQEINQKLARLDQRVIYCEKE
jgi:hypothetical protein